MGDLLHQPVVRAALEGALVAAAIDYAAFRSWKSWQEAARYDWRTASFRWVQGAVYGAMTGLGLAGLTGG